MNNQLYMVDGHWVNRDRMEKARGLGKYAKNAEATEEVQTHQEEVNTPKIEDTSELEQLKALCDKKGIKYHHASKEKKLKSLLGLE